MSDATLRDSAHMAGVAFTPADATVIAALLRDVGVDAVEVGIVSRSDRGDVGLCRAVLDEIGAERSMTLVLARSRAQVRADLDVVVELGFRSVMVSIPTSSTHARLKLGTGSRRRILALAGAAIAEAKELGLHVTFSAEDGARTDPDFLAEYVAHGKDAGADRFRLAETVSVLRPADTERLVRAVVAAAPRVEVEIHSHNMLGLSVANALAAVDAGASWISCTVGGLGERGGNTPLAEVLACMWRFWADDRYDLAPLTHLSREVAERSGVGFGATAGVTSELGYAYEIAGQWRYPEMFEAVPAELVGSQRQVRVRDRLRPPLLQACLPSDLIADVDLESVVKEVLANLPEGKGTLGAEDLATAVSVYVNSAKRGGSL
jgi:homocitrate synthase NifV